MLDDLPVSVHLLLFVASAVAIAFAGTKLAEFADRFADRTGLGEAITGALLLGLITALPGIATSATAAVDGYTALSISNALGGIAIQTVFLAIGDICYPRTNLEHAAASAPNMMQAAVLIALIGLIGLALTGPSFTLGHVHPVSLLLFGVAIIGFKLVHRTRERPMWRPKRTAGTVEDRPGATAREESLPRLVGAIVPTAAIVLVSGAVVAETAGQLADRTGISESIMGGIFTAVATSLPELVTSVAAVRRGALTLAVSDIVGGNCFDVLSVSTADIAYLNGSLYHAGGVGDREVFLGGLAGLMNVVVLMGLIYRQQRGPANIGFESVSIVVLYGCGVLVLWCGM